MFQAVRNAYDLNTMSVPVKYRTIGDFHEYYSGKRVAPYLTIFVGGNHEASSHLQELYYGGWVAKNIYYLGAVNVVRFGGLRIAGLSGIWKGYNYNKPHFERLPYSANETKSLYHVRELDVRKLLLVRTQVDIGISHDWPRGVEWQGDYKTLFRQKDLFEADARAGTLGSSAARYVIDRLRPPHWFAAHLHCKFAARIVYDDEAKPMDEPPKVAPHATKNDDEIDIELDDVQPEQSEPVPLMKNLDEIDLDLDDEDTPEVGIQSSANGLAETATLPPNTSAVPPDIRAQLPAAFTRPPPAQKEQLPVAPPPPLISNKITEFLALDKCLPNRKFLQILEIEPLHVDGKDGEAPKLAYDSEWLAILRVFSNYDPRLPFPPNPGEVAYTPLIQAQEAWVEENLVKTNNMFIPENFELTAPIYDGRDIKSIGDVQPKEYSNPQTNVFCNMLGITNWFDISEEEREELARVKGLKNKAEASAGGYGHGRGQGGGRGRGSGRGGLRGRGGRGRGRGSR